MLLVLQSKPAYATSCGSDKKVVAQHDTRCHCVGQPQDQTSQIRLQIRLLRSDFRDQTSEIRLHRPNFRNQTSQIKLQRSDFTDQTSEI